MNVYAELYSIAEAAHKGCDDEYIRDLCADLASETGKLAADLYNQAEAIYRQEFER